MKVAVGILEALGQKYGTDKRAADNHHAYLDIYERYFANIRQSAETVAEIGVFHGASLRMWAEYFAKATICGFDLTAPPAALDNTRIRIVLGNQSKREDLERLIDVTGVPDVIIDDGGHAMEQQQVSLGFLFRFLKPGGLYVIEDLSTSYTQGPQEWNPTDTQWTTLVLLQALQAGQVFGSEFIALDEMTFLLDATESVVIEKGAHSEIAFVRKRT